MKKIINGKMYNTETAKELGFWSNGENGFGFCDEWLYRKKTGEYFLYGKGGGMSKYCSYNGNMYGPGERITPLTEAEAKKWAEDYLDADEYEEIFGTVEE